MNTISLATIMTAALLAAGPVGATEWGPARVVAVHAGDTVTVEWRPGPRDATSLARLHLIRATTPRPDEPYGREAIAFTRRAVLGQRVSVLFGATGAVSQDILYGPGRGNSLTYALVRAGLARTTETAEPALRAAQANARRAGRGMWGVGGIRPFLPKEDGPMEHRLNLTGAMSGIQAARRVVVRDAKAWTALWREHAPPRGGEAPSVDFARYDVVAVFAGSKPTGGHAVEIGAVTREGRTVTVTVTLLKPGPGTITTQAFTSPFAMRAVPKLPPVVTFDVTEKAR